MQQRNYRVWKWDALKNIRPVFLMLIQIYLATGWLQVRAYIKDKKLHNRTSSPWDADPVSNLAFVLSLTHGVIGVFLFLQRLFVKYISQLDSPTMKRLCEWSAVSSGFLTLVILSKEHHAIVNGDTNSTLTAFCCILVNISAFNHIGVPDLFVVIMTLGMIPLWVSFLRLNVNQGDSGAPMAIVASATLVIIGLTAYMQQRDYRRAFEGEKAMVDINDNFLTAIKHALKRGAEKLKNQGALIESGTNLPKPLQRQLIGNTIAIRYWYETISAALTPKSEFMENLAATSFVKICHDVFAEYERAMGKSVPLFFDTTNIDLRITSRTNLFQTLIFGLFEHRAFRERRINRICKLSCIDDDGKDWKLIFEIVCVSKDFEKLKLDAAASTPSSSNPQGTDPTGGTSTAGTNNNGNNTTNNGNANNNNKHRPSLRHPHNKRHPHTNSASAGDAAGEMKEGGNSAGGVLTTGGSSSTSSSNSSSSTSIANGTSNDAQTVSLSANSGNAADGNTVTKNASANNGSNGYILSLEKNAAPKSDFESTPSGAILSMIAEQLWQHKFEHSVDDIDEFTVETIEILLPNDTCRVYSQHQGPPHQHNSNDLPHQLQRQLQRQQIPSTSSSGANTNAPNTANSTNSAINHAVMMTLLQQQAQAHTSSNNPTTAATSAVHHHTQHPTSSSNNNSIHITSTGNHSSNHSTTSSYLQTATPTLPYPRSFFHSPNNLPQASLHEHNISTPLSKYQPWILLTPRIVADPTGGRLEIRTKLTKLCVPTQMLSLGVLKAKVHHLGVVLISETLLAKLPLTHEQPASKSTDNHASGNATGAAAAVAPATSGTVNATSDDSSMQVTDFNDDDDLIAPARKPNTNTNTNANANNASTISPGGSHTSGSGTQATGMHSIAAGLIPPLISTHAPAGNNNGHNATGHAALDFDVISRVELRAMSSYLILVCDAEHLPSREAMNTTYEIPIDKSLSNKAALSDLFGYVQDIFNELPYEYDSHSHNPSSNFNNSNYNIATEPPSMNVRHHNNTSAASSYHKTSGMMTSHKHNTNNHMMMSQMMMTSTIVDPISEKVSAASSSSSSSSTTNSANNSLRRLGTQSINQGSKFSSMSSSMNNSPSNQLHVGSRGGSQSVEDNSGGGIVVGVRAGDLVVSTRGREEVKEEVKGTSDKDLLETLAYIKRLLDQHKLLYKSPRHQLQLQSSPQHLQARPPSSKFNDYFYRKFDDLIAMRIQMIRDVHEAIDTHANHSLSHSHHSGASTSVKSMLTLLQDPTDKRRASLAWTLLPPFQQLHHLLHDTSATQINWTAVQTQAELTLQLVTSHHCHRLELWIGSLHDLASLLEHLSPSPSVPSPSSTTPVKSDNASGTDATSANTTTVADKGSASGSASGGAVGEDSHQKDANQSTTSTTVVTSSKAVITTTSSRSGHVVVHSGKSSSSDKSVDVLTGGPLHGLLEDLEEDDLDANDASEASHSGANGALKETAGALDMSGPLPSSVGDVHGVMVLCVQRVIAVAQVLLLQEITSTDPTNNHTMKVKSR